MSTNRKQRQTTTQRPTQETLERDAAMMPPLLRYGMWVVLLQCAAVFVYIITLLMSQLRGTATSTIESDTAAANYVSLGTAIFLAIIFGFVAWVAVQTLRDQPRSQGAIMLIEFILLGVAIYMFRGGVPALGAATLLTSVFVLVALLHPDTRRFEEARYALRTGRS